MKQSGMFTWLLFVSVSLCTISTKSLSVEGPQEEAEQQAWRYDMYRSLLDHANINVRITAAAVLEDGYDVIDNVIIDRHEIDAVSLLNLIQQGIKDPHASWQSLMIMRSLCQTDSFKGSCDASTINDRLISLRPHDLSSYLTLLNQAHKQGDDQAIKVILERMSEATQATFLFQVDPTTKAAMTDFVNSQPIPDESPELVDAADQQGIELPELFIAMELMYLKLTGNYIMTGYDFKPLTEVCQGEQPWLSSCEAIGDMLLKDSDSFIYQTIGQRLLKLVYKTQGRVEEQGAVEQWAVDQQRYLTCIGQTMWSAWKHNLTDLSYLKTFTGSTHEGQSAETLAQLSYQHLMQTDPEQAIDPATCGLRHQTAQ
jgi:hypothetical protein